MRRDHAGDLAKLAGQGAVGIAGIVRRTHAAVSDQVHDRVSAHIGPAATPVRVSERAVSSAVYGAVRVGLSAAGAIVEQGVRARATGDSEPGAGSQRALAVLDGAVGDRLHEAGSSLAIPMSLRGNGIDVLLERAALLSAYGECRPHLVVFVHGLIENETAWAGAADRHGPGGPATLGERLDRDLGLQPLYVRYNSGRGIADNGADLADLLDRLADAWPETDADVILIGHSMGGLVIDAALADGRCPRVRATVSLGTPWEGAPLERMAVRAGQAAQRTPQARWLADLIDVRSAGVRDLGSAPVQRYGDRLPHLAVHGSLAIVGSMLGDGVVPLPRAGTEHVVLDGLNHQDLLNHPRVHDVVAHWLATTG